MGYKLRSAEQVIESIKVIYGFKTLTNISNYFGKQSNWATQMIKKNSIPYPQIAQVSEEKGVSMDMILYGIDNPLFNKNEFLQDLSNGISESSELGILQGIDEEKAMIAARIILKKIDKYDNQKS